MSKLSLVLELAQQNVLEDCDDEMQDEADRQQEAVDSVEAAAGQLADLVGCDQHTFEDRLANADAEYIGTLYRTLTAFIPTEDKQDAKSAALYQLQHALRVATDCDLLADLGARELPGGYDDVNTFCDAVARLEV